MGLFDKRDKKRRDDFDSPVESVDLEQAARSEPVTTDGVVALDQPKTPTGSAKFVPPMPRAASASSAPAAAPTALAGGSTTSQRAAVPAPAPASKSGRTAAPADPDSYGIDKAIELMRTLPTENIQLVVQVVKHSLESVGIKLPVIIEDATRRQKDLRGRVDVLSKEIAELELEIRQRKEEIAGLEADYRETTVVRERLEMAEGVARPRPGTPSGSPMGTATPSPMGTATPSPIVTIPPKK